MTEASPSILARTRAILTQTARSWNDHDTPRVCAALAWYTLFSLAPILLITTAVASAVFGPEAARAELSVRLVRLIGETGALAVEDLLADAHLGGSSGTAAIIGTLTLLFGATGCFAELQHALNRIWDAPPPTRHRLWTLLRTRAVSFLLVLVIGLLLLVLLIVTTVIAGISDRFIPGLSSPAIMFLLDTTVSLFAGTGLFAVIYKVLPDRDITWKDVRFGAFITAILFAVGKQLIALYLGHSAIASTFGAAGSFAVLLMWMYYSALVILFGAELTRAYAFRPGGPRDLGPTEPVSPPPRAAHAPALAAPDHTLRPQEQTNPQ